jgi:hypothetical protein
VPVERIELPTFGLQNQWSDSLALYQNLFNGELVRNSAKWSQFTTDKEWHKTLPVELGGREGRARNRDSNPQPPGSSLGARKAPEALSCQMSSIGIL